MAAITYSILTGAKTTTGSIKSWLNRDITPVDDILGDAEDWIYERLRVRDMLTRATGTMTVDEPYITRPSDWLGAYNFWLTGDDRRELRYVPPSELDGRRFYDTDGTVTLGTPLRYSADGTQIQFDWSPESAFAYAYRYYARPAALSSSNETNFLTTGHRRLLRSAILMIAYQQYHPNDRLAAKNEAIAGDALMAAQEADEMGHGPLDMVTTIE